MIPPAIKAWQEANPEVAKECRRADQILEEAQTELVRRLTDRISNELVDNEFMLDEFLDTWGRRLGAFNEIRRVLLTLGIQE